jgi:hypothetical protein
MSCNGACAVDRAVAGLNIAHYRRLLADETDPARRQTILRLLAEEEAKLADSKPAEKSANEPTQEKRSLP